MTDIDFYILNSDQPLAKELMACRLAEKVYKLGRNVQIHTHSAEQGDKINQLLWTFRSGSFVPHNLADQIENEQIIEPVIISHGEALPHHTDVLINLTNEVPLIFSRFERVSEIIPANEKTSGRERFKFYRDRGYPLKSHKINN